jgi:hypothetical protein
VTKAFKSVKILEIKNLRETDFSRNSQNQHILLWYRKKIQKGESRKQSWVNPGESKRSQRNIKTLTWFGLVWFGVIEN